MPAHDWKVGGYVHKAPGAVDIWDQRATCNKCGTKAVLIGQSATNAVNLAAYEIHLRSKRGKDRVEMLRELKRVPEDCEQMVVDDVHSR